MNELTHTMLDIARTPLALQTEAGPNTWDLAKDDSTQFGPEEDFTVDNHGSVFIFNPVSKAALQWCYAKLPEDCPRWGAKGFVIEHNYIEMIVAAAQRDNLMSRQDYEDAMEENHNQALQAEL